MRSRASNRFDAMRWAFNHGRRDEYGSKPDDIPDQSGRIAIVTGANGALSISSSLR